MFAEHGKKVDNNQTKIEGGISRAVVKRMINWPKLHMLQMSSNSASSCDEEKANNRVCKITQLSKQLNLLTPPITYPSPLWPLL